MSDKIKQFIEEGTIGTREWREKWCRFCTDNIDSIRRDVKMYQLDPAYMRNIMSEYGMELTPKELKDLILVVSETLKLME